MSTGENINANGSMLTAEMIRFGFHQFPQSMEVWISPSRWPAIGEMLMAQGNPFRATESPTVPNSEVWFMGTDWKPLGRIINLG